MADIEYLINEQYNKPQHSFGLSCKVCDGVCKFNLNNEEYAKYYCQHAIGCYLHPDGSCAKPKNSSASQMGFIDPETGEIVWPDKGTDELAQSPLHEDSSYLCSLCNKFHDPEYLCYGINYCIRCGSISHKSEDCPKF